MYIIEKGSAYLIDGNKAYKVSFNLNKNMTFDKENAIDVEGHQKYTYDEIVRKLNIDFSIAAKRQELEQKANVKEMATKIEELTAENDSLSSKIEELTAEIAELTKPVQEQAVESTDANADVPATEEVPTEETSTEEKSKEQEVVEDEVKESKETKK